MHIDMDKIYIFIFGKTTCKLFVTDREVCNSQNIFEKDDFTLPLVPPSFYNSPGKDDLSSKPKYFLICFKFITYHQSFMKVRIAMLHHVDCTSL